MPPTTTLLGDKHPGPEHVAHISLCPPLHHSLGPYIVAQLPDDNSLPPPQVLPHKDMPSALEAVKDQQVPHSVLTLHPHVRVPQMNGIDHAVLVLSPDQTTNDESALLAVVYELAPVMKHMPGPLPHCPAVLLQCSGVSFVPLCTQGHPVVPHLAQLDPRQALVDDVVMVCLVVGLKVGCDVRKMRRLPNRLPPLRKSAVAAARGIAVL